MRYTSHRLIIAILLALLAGSLPVAPVAAQTEFTVNSTADTDDPTPDGACTGCTLREALREVTAGGATIKTIRFAASLNGATINVGSQLPTISGSGITVDGLSSGGMVGLVGIAGISGLLITGSGNTVRGLALQNFTGLSQAGIKLSGTGASGNLIDTIHAGTNLAGSAAAANETGILIVDGASNNIVQNSLVSGNTNDGILLGQRLTSDAIINNQFYNNTIGLNKAGTAALPNGQSGIYIEKRAGGTIVGAPGKGNVISGNQNDSQAGIVITSQDGVTQTISSNLIGTDAAGTAAIGNFYGIYMTSGDGVLIEDNTIAGNSNQGIYSLGNGATRFTIRNNNIGVNKNGNGPLGNGNGPDDGSGILINVTVGGSVSGINILDNVIAANGSHGISLRGDGVQGVTIRGNRIGTDDGGSQDFGNSLNGVNITFGCNPVGPTNVVVGGDITDAAQRNIISGNSGAGVNIEGASGNSVFGNYIGVAANGISPLANATSEGAGVVLAPGVDSTCSATTPNANNNVIGGTGNQRNLIGGNGNSPLILAPGVLVQGNNLSGNLIRGNHIGLATNNTTVGNAGQGIYIQGADNTRVEDNVIVGNPSSAIFLDLFNAGEFPLGSRISGNYIGVRPEALTTPLANDSNGVTVRSAMGNINTEIGPNNTIALNTRPGIRVNADTSGVKITQNAIYGNNSSASPANPINIQLVNTTTSNGGIDSPTNVAYDGVSKLLGRATKTGDVQCGLNECTVEIFSTPNNATAVPLGESRAFITSVKTRADGTWEADVSERRHQFLTATTTDDANGNSSNFSSPVNTGSVPPIGQPAPVLSPASQPSQTVNAQSATQVVTYSHLLTNTGSADNFTLAVVAPGGGLTASVQPSSQFSLAKNQSIPVTVTVTVPQGSAAGSYTTTVRASVVQTPSIQSVQSDVTVVSEQRGFQLTPASLSGTTSPGVAIDYTYRITNSGNLTETFSFAFGRVSGEPRANVTVNNGNPLTLSPGSAVDLPVRVLIPIDATLPSAVTVVTATVTSGNPGTRPAPIAVQQNTTIRQLPVPVWSTSGLTGTTTPNTPISYTLTLTNAGLASGTFTVTVAPASAAGWSFAVEPAATNQFALAPGANRLVTVVVTPTSLISGSQLSLDLTATTDQATQATTRVTTRVGLSGNFDLTPSAERFSPGVVPRGSSYSYVYTLTNQSNFTETFSLSAGRTGGEPNVTVSLTPPSPLTLGPTQSSLVSVTVAVGATTTQGTVASSLVVTASGGLSPTTATRLQNTAIELVPQPLWGPQPVNGFTPPGTPISYTLTLTNAGLASGSFTVTLDAPVTSTWTYAVTPAPPSSTNLAVSEAVTFTVVVTPGGLPTEVISGTSYTLTLTALTDKGTQAALPIRTTATQIPRLALSGAPAVTTPPGQTVAFTNLLTNTGNGRDTFLITPPATIPGVISAVSAPTQLTLDPGQSAPLVVAYTIVAGATGGNYTRNITVTSQTSATVTASAPNTITISSAVAPAIEPRPAQGANIGEVITFTHVVTNVGNIAGNFTVTVDSLPAGIQAASVTPSGPFPLNRFLDTAAPGYTRTVQVSFTISPTALAGSYNIPVSVAAGGITASVTDTINVAFSAGVDLGPGLPPGAAGVPGSVLTYTHLLTNTGNGIDSFTVTLSSTPPGWSTSPTQTIMLAPGVSTTVVVSATVPRGLLAGTAVTLTTNAQSQNDPLKQDTAAVTATVLPLPELTFLPPIQNGFGGAGDRVTYTLSLSNSGNITDSFALSLTNSLTWSVELTPSTVSNLAPGAAATLTLTVQIPPGTPDNSLNLTIITGTSTLSPTISGSAQVTTTVAKPFDLLFTKNEASTARPRDVVDYTHRLTNTGLFSDSFVLQGFSNLGWSVRVVPPIVSELGPGQSVTVTVQVTVPPRTAATRSEDPVFIPHVARVRASSVNDSRISAEVRDTTTVTQVAALDFTPPRSARVSAGETVIYQHRVTNLGNGVDRFRFTATSSNGWPVSLSASQSPDLPPALPGFNSSPSFDLRVTVRVPTSVQEGEIDNVTVTAISVYDGTITRFLIDSSVVPLIQSTDDPRTELRVWFPLVRR